VTPAPKNPLLGVRVLLVDDDEDLRDLFALVLQEAGADVRAASDAEDAMRTVLAWHPSVVVSDLSMPTKDGITLLREVRSVDPRRHIPAIAVSAWTEPGHREAALAAGFQELVTKPLTPHDLVAVVKRWSPPTPA
jgi:CheY-like chemotaxis protein